MKIINIATLSTILLLAGCVPKQVMVYQSQPLQIVHPRPAQPLVFKNPEILAVSGKTMASYGSLPENTTKIFYILSTDSMSDLLDDDVQKLDFAQYESGRANFYKESIIKYNDTIKQRNAEEAKKGKLTTKNDK